MNGGARHVVGVLGFKSQPRVDECLESIRATEKHACEIWLVDNSPEPLAVPNGVIGRHVYDTTHGGFTAALRWFLAAAVADRRTTATFVNDDLVFEPGCLDAMIAAAMEPRVAVACPMQVAKFSPQMIVCGGTGPAYPAGRHRTGQRGRDCRERRDMRWMPFAACSFSIPAVADIGLPDDNMTTWFSDSDYCIRARLHGFRVVYLGDNAVVRHEVSASCAAIEPVERRRRFTHDRLAFRRKWGGAVLAAYRQ